MRKIDTLQYGTVRFNDKTPQEALQKYFPEVGTDLQDLQNISTAAGKMTAERFYHDFGLLTHPFSGKPLQDLAEYQYKVWNDGFKYRYRLTVKSQKIGISTSTLMEDFQKAILPPTNKWSCCGKEILIISQTVKHAQEHLRTLREMILQSMKYSKFLVTKATEMVLRDEVTKVSVLYIKNPWNPRNQTRILALGPKEQSLWSWKEVKHIHMSDVAAINQVDDTGSFGAAMSRLMTTRGSLHIETPPRGQRGKVWELYKTFAPGISQELTESQKAAAFHVETIKVEQAIQAGVVSKEDIEAERERNPVLFNQLYQCEFMNPNTQWYEDAMMKYNKELAEDFVV